MNQNEELCLFNEEGSSIDSVPKDLLGRLFTLIIEPNDSNDEKYRLRRLFNKDLINNTYVKEALGYYTEIKSYLDKYSTISKLESNTEDFGTFCDTVTSLEETFKIIKKS